MHPRLLARTAASTPFDRLEWLSLLAEHCLPGAACKLAVARALMWLPGVGPLLQLFGCCDASYATLRGHLASGKVRVLEGCRRGRGRLDALFT